MNRRITVLQTVALPLGYVAGQETLPLEGAFSIGADYGARTRHLHLGKVALDQMS